MTDAGPTGGPTVSPQAWNHLCHARAVYVLAEAGIDSIVLKGPTTTRWLYGDDPRAAGDVDLLVSPGDVDRAVAVLCERGACRVVSMTPALVPGYAKVHAVTLESERPAYELDLHYRFPGSEGSERRAWEALWARRLPLDLAGTPMWQLDLSGRALVLAIHAARSTRVPKVAEDFRRCLAALGPDDWADVLALADTIDARAGLVSGLRTTSAGHEVLAWLGVDDGPDPDWLLRNAGAAHAQYALRIARASGVERLSLLRRAVWPAAEFMHKTRPLARQGAVGLVAARVLRLLRLVLSAPSVAWTIRRAHRAARLGEAGGGEAVSDGGSRR